MNLLYNKNIIRKESTRYKGKVSLKIVRGKKDNELLNQEEIMKQKIIDAQNKYEEIIKNTNEESLKIIELAKTEALNIEKKAYEEGHSQGIKNGYEDGYKEAYEENIEKAKIESEQIIENANNILLNAKHQVIDYMKYNRENILSLSISIAEKVLREKFEDKSAMDNILTSVIQEHKVKSNMVIKTNSIYKDNLYKQISILKESKQFNSDVFVIGDECMEKGNAVIETEKGRIIIGIDSVLDKIKEELL